MDIRSPRTIAIVKGRPAVITGTGTTTVYGKIKTYQWRMQAMVQRNKGHRTARTQTSDSKAEED